MKSPDERDHAAVTERLKDLARVESVLKQAAHQAVQERARAGTPIAVWRDGQVVWEVPQVTERPNAEHRSADH